MSDSDSAATTNPLGPSWARPTEADGKPIGPPHEETREKQDPAQTEGDFLDDLEKATRQKPASS